MNIKLIRKNLARIILVLNVAAMVAVWVVCLSTWITPTDHPRLASLGLLFPVFLVIELCFAGVWLFVKPRWTWIPLAGLLPCIGFLLDYCPVSLHKELPDGCLKIITWNTDGFGGHQENKDSARSQAMLYIENCNADIICLQEAHMWKWALQMIFDDMDSIGYEHDEYLGLILFTRLPIINSDTITYETYKENGVAGNGSKWYHLKYGNDTILLVNNHLESNHLVAQLKDEYRESLEQTEYKKLKESGDTISNKLFDCVKRRGPQADSIAALIERNQGKDIIVCGDFNDTPISYTYQRINKLLNNAYRQSGTGIGVSYNQKGFWVRIDHLFVSDQWETYNTFIDNSIKVSDHYPLISWLKKQ